MRVWRSRSQAGGYLPRHALEEAEVEASGSSELLHPSNLTSARRVRGEATPTLPYPFDWPDYRCLNKLSLGPRLVVAFVPRLPYWYSFKDEPRIGASP